MSYQFLDAYASVLSADSDTSSGAHRPIVEIGSILGTLPITISGNQSVSGTVNIGTMPGSVLSQQLGTRITSVSGAVSVAGAVLVVDATGAEMDLFKQGDNFASGSDHGLMILGLTDGTPQKYQPLRVTSVLTDGISNAAVRLDVASALKAFNGTSWDRVRTGSTTGAILVSQADKVISSVISSTPSSMLVGASIIGLTPVTATITGNPSISGTVNIGTIPGSVLAFQAGTMITSVISSTPSSMLVGASIIGLTPVTIANTNINVGGSVLAQQLGTVRASVINSVPSSLLTGVYGHRNDAVASYLGGNLTWNPMATDSAGRTLYRPFAAEESRIEGYVTLTSTSLTTLVAAAGAGLKNYITDLFFANTGSVTTLITMTDSAASVLGYTIAPAGSGSNIPGLMMPIRTSANASFNIQAGSPTSTLYATVKGFKAP